MQCRSSINSICSSSPIALKPFETSRSIELQTTPLVMSSGETPSLLSLPKDCVQLIMSQVALGDYARLLRVCKRLHGFGMEPVVRQAVLRAGLAYFDIISPIAQRLLSRAPPPDEQTALDLVVEIRKYLSRDRNPPIDAVE